MLQPVPICRGRSCWGRSDRAGAAAGAAVRVVCGTEEDESRWLGAAAGGRRVCYRALLSRHPTLPATEAAHLCFVLSDNSKKQVKKNSNEQNSSVRNFMLYQ